MVNPISFPTPQAYSSGADFSQLANLGNVYRQAQEDAAKQAALGKLGQGVDADAMALLHSGVPSLAQIGLNMQQSALNRQREDVRYSVTDARANAELAIQQAAAKRAQETYEKQDTDEEAAAKLIAGLPGGRPPAPVAPSADVFTRGAPSVAPSPGLAAPGLPAPPQQPLDPALAPGAVPPTAQGEVPPSPIAPSQLAATVSAAPPSMVDRVAGNLTSGAPAAAAGISRDQIAELYRNPLTRPIATAFLQKQFSPGTWKYEKLDDGRLIAANESTGETKDVTPPTATGAPPALKDQRERDARYADAKARGYDDATANYVAINGKLPKEDLTPTEMKAVTDAQKQVTSGQDVLDNLSRLKELSPKAWSGWGATTRASFVNALLPNDYIPQGAVNTKEMANLALQNVAGQAKAVFGARLAVAEVKLLNQIETTPEMSDAERQAVYARIERMINRHVDAASAEAEGIKNKTYFKPGGGGPQAAPAASSAAPAGRPPLGTIFGQ